MASVESGARTTASERLRRIERFTLHLEQGATRLEYTGELGAGLLGAGPLVG